MQQAYQLPTTLDNDTNEVLYARELRDVVNILKAVLNVVRRELSSHPDPFRIFPVSDFLACRS